jgi:hypothetical protein
MPSAAAERSLISGGGSALLSLPAPGISLPDKQAVSRALLRCGAPIGDINCVRKHLSAMLDLTLAYGLPQRARLRNLVTTKDLQTHTQVWWSLLRAEAQPRQS